jgi:hypothetical protein
MSIEHPTLAGYFDEWYALQRNVLPARDHDTAAVIGRILSDPGAR